MTVRITGPLYLQEESDGSEHRLEVHAPGSGLIGHLAETESGFKLLPDAEEAESYFAGKTFASAHEALEAFEGFLGGSNQDTSGKGESRA